MLCLLFGQAYYGQKKKSNKKKAIITNRNISVDTPSNNVDGYESTFVTTGDLKCSNITPKYDYSIKTKLYIKNTGNTDLVSKLMNKNEETAYRIVYIKPNEEVVIENIPQGIYYLKHAAGKNWYQKITDGKCVGIFKNEYGYYMGKGILDFNLKETVTERGKTISTPIFEISAGVQSSSLPYSNPNKISSEEFNK